MIEGTVGEFAATCRTAGIEGLIAWVSLTRPGAIHDVVREAAEGAGLRFASAAEEFAKHPYREIALPFDQHPNQLGHRLIADVLYRHLLAGGYLAAP
jgi:hypothetical protein